VCSSDLNSDNATGFHYEEFSGKQKASSEARSPAQPVLLVFFDAVLTRVCWSCDADVTLGISNPNVRPQCRWFCTVPSTVADRACGRVCRSGCPRPTASPPACNCWAFPLLVIVKCPLALVSSAVARLHAVELSSPSMHTPKKRRAGNGRWAKGGGASSFPLDFRRTLTSSCRKAFGRLQLRSRAAVGLVLQRHLAH
jgi:hypothetical protein